MANVARLIRSWKIRWSAGAGDLPFFANRTWGLSASLGVFLAFATIVALQALKVNWMVPFSQITDGRPLIEYKYSQIYIDILNDRELTARSGRSWGYDPCIGAGQPTGAGLIRDSHAPILLDRALGRALPADAVIKIFVWIALMAAPILVFFAARMMGFGGVTSIIAMALAASGMLAFDQHARILAFQGNVAFLFGCYIALFNAGALYAAMLRDRRWAFAAFGLSLPLIPLMDLSLAVLHLIPLVAIAAAGYRRMTWFGLVWIAVGLALTAAVNNFWLTPFLEFFGYVESNSEWPSRGLRGMARAFLPTSGNFPRTAQSVVRAYLLLFGIAELVTAPIDRRPLVRTLAIWATAYCAVGFFGSDVAWLRQISPGRFVFPFMLVFIVPAAAFMVTTLLRPGTLRLWLSLWTLWFLLSWQAEYTVTLPPIRNQLSAREEHLLVDLNRLPADRRVLVQYEPYITDVLRLTGVQTKHAYVGFAGSWWHTKFGRGAVFSNWGREQKLFNEPLDSYDRDTLVPLLDRYNVGHVIVTSTVARDFMRKMPADFAEVPTLVPDGSDSYWIFKTASRGSGYMISGNADVEFGPDRIRLRSATAGPLVLSFHWIKGVKADVPVGITPVYFEHDPIPFIGIDNEAGHASIEVRYAP